MRSKPYEQFFNEMNLNDKQKEKRKKLARKTETTILFIFSLISIMREYNRLREDYIIRRLNEELHKTLKDEIPIDSYIEDYITQFSQDIVRTTLNHPDEEFYLSEDRSVLISENNANDIYNYTEYRDAIRSGKTMKRWKDMKDDRERSTHLEVGGRSIPIGRPFVVGQSLMMFPKDISLGASMEEIANCRCTVEYF